MLIKRSNRDNIAEMVEAVVAAKTDLAEAQERFDYAQTSLINTLKESDQDSVTRNGWRVKVVVRTTLSVDEESLIKIVGKRVFNTFTKRVVDRAKIEEAITAGEITAETVAPAFTHKPSKPYLLITKETAPE